MSLDFTTVHNFLHGTETITLDYQETGVASVSIEKALQQHVMVEDGPGNWIVVSNRKTWYLPGSGLARDPTTGDAIQEAGGTRWTILDCAKEPLTAQWECHTVKEQ